MKIKFLSLYFIYFLDLMGLVFVYVVLSPLIVDEVFAIIASLNEQGISFLLVEQNARKGLSVAHRGYVLESGQNRLTGSGENLLEDPEVQRLYLGG